MERAADVVRCLRSPAAVRRTKAAPEIRQMGWLDSTDLLQRRRISSVIRIIDSSPIFFSEYAKRYGISDVVNMLDDQPNYAQRFWLIYKDLNKQKPYAEMTTEELWNATASILQEKGDEWGRIDLKHEAIEQRDAMRKFSNRYSMLKPDMKQWRK